MSYFKAEGHGVWFPLRGMYDNSNFFNLCDVLDTNDKTKNDELYVYKIDMYGAVIGNFQVNLIMIVMKLIIL